MPHVYIRAIVLDESRDTIYGQTFTPENLVSYDLKTGESRWIGPTSSGMTMAQGENICLDDNGCVWGVTRAWQIHDVCVTPDGVLYAGEAKPLPE